MPNRQLTWPLVSFSAVDMTVVESLVSKEVKIGGFFQVYNTLFIHRRVTVDWYHFGQFIPMMQYSEIKTSDF